MRNSRGSTHSSNYGTPGREEWKAGDTQHDWFSRLPRRGTRRDAGAGSPEAGGQ
jgi:hypothetical protein